MQRDLRVRHFLPYKRSRLMIPRLRKRQDDIDEYEEVDSPDEPEMRGNEIYGIAVPFERESLPIAPDMVEVIDRNCEICYPDAGAVALYDHNSSYLLGRTTNGTMELEPHEDGLYMRLRPVRTSWSEDVKELVRTETVAGMSIGFVPLDEDIEEYNEAEPVNMEMRPGKHFGRIRVKRMELHEVSLVPLPAYPDTTAEMRKQDYARYRQRAESKLNKRAADEAARKQERDEFYRRLRGE